MLAHSLKNIAVPPPNPSRVQCVQCPKPASASQCVSLIPAPSPQLPSPAPPLPLAYTTKVFPHSSSVPVLGLSGHASFASPFLLRSLSPVLSCTRALRFPLARPRHRRRLAALDIIQAICILYLAVIRLGFVPVSRIPRRTHARQPPLSPHPIYPISHLASRIDSAHLLISLHPQPQSSAISTTAFGPSLGERGREKGEGGGGQSWGDTFFTVSFPQPSNRGPSSHLRSCALCSCYQLSPLLLASSLTRAPPNPTQLSHALLLPTGSISRSARGRTFAGPPASLSLASPTFLFCAGLLRMLGYALCVCLCPEPRAQPPWRSSLLRSSLPFPPCPPPPPLPASVCTLSGRGRRSSGHGTRSGSPGSMAWVGTPKRRSTPKLPKHRRGWVFLRGRRSLPVLHARERERGKEPRDTRKRERVCLTLPGAWTRCAEGGLGTSTHVERFGWAMADVRPALRRLRCGPWVCVQ
ncbi:hypothetical protein C8Q74DRAFT_607233 [Fomes fomentarius]|nr:hypothetical protein C8Q74DRAFT_607233 [Fomes fomentarius]